MRLLVFIFLFSIIFQACKKPYNDPPVKEGISSLVVEGSISNESPPYTIKLTKSVPYNSQNNPPIVANAKMSIIDNLGNIENIIEKPPGSGNYISSPTGIQGRVGRNYKLKIALTDGKGAITDTYESDWEKINEIPIIDSMFAEPGQVQSLLQDYDGTYYTYTQNGLNLFINVKVPANQDYYFQFKSSLLRQYICSSQLLGQIYGWYTIDNPFKMNLKSGIVGDQPQVESFFDGFISSGFSLQKEDSILVIFNNTFIDTMYYVSYLCDSSSAGDIITTNVYSVSKKIYEIYSQENSQISPSNTIFDPIPTQIESNIKCTSDSTKGVLGYFCATSVNRINYYFKQSLGSTYIKFYNINFIPVGLPSEGRDTLIPPKYWFY
jgi:hypothetical protein